MKLMTVNFYNSILYFISKDKCFLYFGEDIKSSTFKGGVYYSIEEIFTNIIEKKSKFMYNVKFDGETFGNYTYNFPCETIFEFEDFEDLKLKYADYFI